MQPPMGVVAPGEKKTCPVSADQLTLMLNSADFTRQSSLNRVGISLETFSLFLFFICRLTVPKLIYECWNFNSGNYLFTTDTK